MNRNAQPCAYRYSAAALYAITAGESRYRLHFHGEVSWPDQGRSGGLSPILPDEISDEISYA
jgi:hypothetical protein